MKIPEIADRLREIAMEAGLPELRDLADQMRRRTVIRRAAASSQPMTPALAAEIRHYANTHYGKTYAAIGRVFNVNIGRVSEVLRGTR